MGAYDEQLTTMAAINTPLASLSSSQCRILLTLVTTAISRPLSEIDLAVSHSYFRPSHILDPSLVRTDRVASQWPACDRVLEVALRKPTGAEASLWLSQR